MQNHLSRFVSRRYLKRILGVRAIPFDPSSDDVWGFLSKDKSSELVKEHKAYTGVLRGVMGPVKEQHTELGFDEDEFREGCKAAYMKVADIYAKGEPVFQSQCSNMMEEPLAIGLDEQLKRFKAQGKKPVLEVDTVEAKVMLFVKARKFQVFEGPTWLQIIKSLTTSWLGGKSPLYELVVLVEYKVKERFDLLQMSPTVSDPPVETPSQIIGGPALAAVPGPVAAAANLTPEDTGVSKESPEDTKPASNSKVGAMTSRRHLVVLAADLPAEDVPEGKESDFAEFRWRSIGRHYP